MSNPELHVWLIKSSHKPDAYVMESSLNRAVKCYLQRGSMSDHDNIYDIRYIAPKKYHKHAIDGKRLDFLIAERGQFEGVL